MTNHLIAVFASVLISAGVAQPADRDSLKQLPGLHVLVENLDSVALQAGLTRDQLRTDAELKLRLAGIKVFTNATTPHPYAYLYINVVTVPLTETGSAVPFGYAFCADVSLKQILFSDVTGEAVNATTWDMSGISMSHSSNLSSRARDFTKNIVDRFINDWLAVNPR